MVNDLSGGLDLVFTALAHPIRRGILSRLAQGEAAVADLAGPYRVSAPAISKHLRILERAGLLARKKEGRIHRCRAVPRPLDDAKAWIERQRRFWNARLDALERWLDENP